MKKINKNTYKFAAKAGLIGTVIVIGSVLIFKRNERDKIMSKEKNLQIPDFLKKKMNVEPKTANTYVMDETTHEHYAYVKKIEEECFFDDEDEIIEEVDKEETKETYNYEELINQSDKISKIHKEKYDYIRALSIDEQMIVLDNIPINLCLLRVRKEIDELKEFKATISSAMSMLNKND